MKVHFIAIGGSAMHNLAIALKQKGYEVTGSDDEIFEPSRSRLLKYGLLPQSEGWFPERITADLDAVILGMHAKVDNPELKRSHELKILVYSYPEYLYEQAKNKKRVVIGGSHGKTTITSMILHVLQFHNIDCDFMVGAQLEGFEVMVKISESAPIMILEGDEYLTSPIDRRPKFHLYQADIGLISGIAWDHINVFHTFKEYVEQFRIFACQIPAGGSLVYCEADPEVKKIGGNLSHGVKAVPYSSPKFEIKEGKTFLVVDDKMIGLQVFGEHNLMNLNGARLICNELGLSDHQFYEAIQSFTGASKRLEIVASSESTIVFKDFAHSPSKLLATTKAVKEQYPERNLVACLELHTYSSLSANFLDQYRDCMQYADQAIVYYNPHAVALKRLPPVSKEAILKAFGRQDISVYDVSDDLFRDLTSLSWRNTNLLMMSSGDFDGKDLVDLCRIITNS